METAFKRVEIITAMMEYFPPPCNNEKEPSQVQWNKFNHIKRISEQEKRDIKYNLLPQSFEDRINNSNEDWKEWDSVKFLSQVQKFETVDCHEPRKQANKKNKENGKGKKKRSEEDDESSMSNLSCFSEELQWPIQEEA